MNLTVIIPALNEERWLGGCLEAIGREFDGQVVVSDGGSRDATVAVARKYPVEVVSGSPGLADQCNRAVEQARGEVLFFVSADCRPGEGWLASLTAAMRDPAVAVGGFHLRFSDGGWQMALIAFGGNFRARYVGMTLPDQGLFTRREIFEKVRGFCPRSRIPFARYCREAGPYGAFRLLAPSMGASSRDFLERGPWTTVWAHWRTYRQFRREESLSSPRSTF